MTQTKVDFFFDLFLIVDFFFEKKIKKMKQIMVSMRFFHLKKM